MIRALRILLYVTIYAVTVQNSCVSQDLIDVRLRTNNISYPLSLIQIERLSDGGYLIPGSARIVSVDSIRQILIRTDSLFNIIYAKRYRSFKKDVLFSATELSDGNFIVGGVQNRFAVSDYGASVRKVDGQGNTIWHKVYPINRRENGIDIYERPDRSLLMFVITTDETLILHTDSLGTIIDQRRYVIGSEDLEASDIATSDASEYFLIGSRQVPLSFDQQIHITSISVDSVNWHKRYQPDRQAYSTSITMKSDGGLLASGLINDTASGDFNSFVFSLDSTGNLLWANEIFHDSLFELRIQQVRENSDGSIIAVGRLQFTPWETHGIVVKLDRNGNLKWSRKHNQLTHQTFVDALPISKGRLLLPSYASGGSYFASIDSLGNSACGTFSTPITIRAVNIVNTSSAIPSAIGTNVVANTPTTAVFPYSINRSVLCVGQLGLENGRPITDVQIYPNPALDRVSVKFPPHFTGISTTRIFDINGRLMLNTSINHDEDIDISTLGSGFYMITIENTEMQLRSKLIKE